jgi:hypothetical protein
LWCDKRELLIFTGLITGFFDCRQVVYRFFCTSSKTERMSKKRGRERGGGDKNRFNALKKQKI